MSYFLDTSALAKVYHSESGTSAMHNILFSGETIYISELAR